MVAFYLVAGAVLLLLNAFFVLAEFGAVKVRSSKIEELVNQGNARARLLQHINENLDEYLSVCQVGITLASIALGFVGEPLAKMLIQPWIERLGVVHVEQWSHGIASVVGVLVVSGVHVLFGEQIPKLIAIRHADRAASLTAVPLRISRAVFFLPLTVLNGASQLILRLFGLHAPPSEQHSEDELRIILDRSQSTGVMSFRRLLFMENIFELGELKVADAMRRRASVRFLHRHAPWQMNLEVMRAYRFSRFPLLESDQSEKPLGVIHVKDLILKPYEPEPDLLALARPFISTAENAPLESLLAEMQRRRAHVAIVFGEGGAWTGFITMEDIIEEIIGTVADEFETEAAVSLGDVLTPERVILGLEAGSLAQAIRRAIARIPDGDLGIDREVVIRAVMERERIAGTYLGKGVAMPHARIPGLPRPVLLFIRSEHGIPVEGTSERANLLFVLLTPAGMARVHQRLQARIAGILENSEYVEDRLRQAATVAEVLEVVRTGEQASLD
jgi:CBS domain containing-hemolysin-like protein/mannitol/fructose-specific phosphotransferase system IIA component (Ntr-type)